MDKLTSRSEFKLKGRPVSVFAAMTEFSISSNIVLKRFTSESDLSFIKFYLLVPENLQYKFGVFELVEIPNQYTLMIINHIARDGSVPTAEDIKFFEFFCEKMFERLAQLGYIEEEPKDKKPLGFDTPSVK